MADLAGVNGTRKDFRVVGKPNLQGVLSWAQATGVAKFGIDYVVSDMTPRRREPSPGLSTSSLGKMRTSRNCPVAVTADS
jgi:hypothetical protein